MRRLILLGPAAAMATALATPASAEGPYATLQGGVYLQRSLSYDFVGLDNFFSTKYSKGYDVSGKLGYDFEGIRIDAELGYKQASTDQFGFMISGQPLAVQRGKGVTGNVNVLSAMLNGYWDITQKRFRPFVGGGVGIARVSSHQVGYSGAGSDGIFLDKSDDAFAFQLMAGVNARITSHVSASVSYRYFDVEHFKLSVFNTTAKSNLHSSSVLGGITYSFGHSVADTPTPPRPPMLPPAPDAATTSSPTSPALSAALPPPVPTSFTITFTPASASLSSDARAELDEAVQGLNRAGHADVMMLGSDASGLPVEYNEALAARRVAAMRAYLLTKAVPRSAIVVQAADVSPSGGSTGLAPRTGAALYISFGPGSGQ